MRVKMDPNRIAGGNAEQSVGKLLYLSHTYRSLTSQELVTYSYGDGGNQGAGKNYFRMYGGWGVFSHWIRKKPGRIQPGSCRGPGLVLQWRLGHDHVPPRDGPGWRRRKSRIEVFAAHPGETSFTRIWNQTFPFAEFEWDNGIDGVMLSTYNNGPTCASQFYHRYDQIIFSKQTIPCPKV